MVRKFVRLLLATTLCGVVVVASSAADQVNASDEYDSRRLTPVVQNVADDNTCTQFTSSAFSWATVGESDVMKTLSGTVTADGTPIANAIVTSGQIDTTGKLSKVTCAVTDASGNYTIQVLRSSTVAPLSAYGQISVSPPNVSKLAASQLGAQTKLILESTTGAQDFSLSAANSMQGFIANDSEEIISAPTNVMCLDANTSGSTWSTIACSLARGRSISATVERIRYASIDVGQGESAPGFTITLSSDPGLIDGDSVVISGLSGTVEGLDLSTLNARWSPIFEVGVTDSKYSFEVLSPLATGKTSLDATGLTGSLTSRQWRSSFTIPNSLTTAAGVVDITAKDIRTRIYSRNIINSQVSSQVRVQALSDWNMSNGVALLTAKTGDPAWMAGAWWSWSITSRALCSAAATTGNFSGAVVTSLSSATAVAGCGSVSVSRRSETAWGGQPGWDYRWAQVTHWEVTSNVAKLYLSGSSDASFSVGESLYIQGFQSPNSGLNGKATITAVTAPSGDSGQTISFARTMADSPKAAVSGWESVGATANIETDPTGIFRGDLPLGDGANQVVQMTYFPRGNSTLVSSATVFKVSVVDGFVTSAQYCDSSYDVQAGTCSGSWVSAPTSSSKYLLLVREANFIGQLIDPAGETIAPSGNTGSTWIEVQQLQTNGSNFYFGGGGSGSSNGVQGVFKLRLSAGTYKLRAGSPQGKNFPPVEVYLKVSGSGSSATFQRCTTFDSSASSESAALTGCTTATASVDAPFALQYGSSDLAGTLQLTNGSAATNAWIELSKPSSNCSECWEWIGGTNSNASGQFSMNFSTAGTYRLTANPPFNDTSGSVRTSWTATVAISGASKTVTINGDSDGSVVLTMDGSNFRGKVLKTGSTGAGFAWTEFQKFNSDEQRYTWSNTTANSNSAGEFNANLTSGTWKIVSRPSQTDSGTFSPSTFYAYVNTTTDPDTISVNSVEGCAIASPGDSCTATGILASDGRFGLALQSPNVSGYVAKSSDVSRNGATGAPAVSNAVPFIWIEVQKFNEYENDYRWTSEVNGANTSSTGQFSVRLPEGKWRLSVNPRPIDTIAGLSRANFDFTVAGNGSITCDKAYSFCAAGESPVAGRFDLHLSSANLSGTVSADGTGVDQAQIRVEKWNGSWWQWANMWANSSNSGSYALNLETQGAYKVTAEIASWKSNAGFSPTSIYVYKAASSLCLLTETQAISATSCPAGSGASLTGNIALTGSNVKGVVKKADNSAVSNTWANILRWNSDFNNWEWLQGTPVSSTGAFNATLRSTLGDTSATAQRFRIEIFPPWGTTQLTKKVVDLWVGDLEDDNSASHTYVVCSATTLSGCDLSAGNIKSSASTLTVVMSGGNIAGTVSGPSSATAANPWVNVEKWTQPAWSQNEQWVWTQINAQGSSSGGYSLDTSTECQASETQCFFRVTANPGWVNPNNWSRVSTIIQVRASDGAYQTTTQTNDFTEPTLASEGGYGSGALNFTLVGSNVTGTVKNSGVAVANSWVGLLKKESGGFYRWLGGANSNSSGGFGLSTAAYGSGRYRLEVNPPWNSTLSRFTKDIVVASDGTFTLCPSTTSVDGDCTDPSASFTLSFPTANLAVKVCDKDDSGSTCTGVSNAYVNVFNSSDGSHVTGSNTQTTGIARFSLADGSYRGEANPNWSNPDGTRVEFTFTVAGGVLTAPATASGVVVAVDLTSTPRQLDVRLGSPNVTGTVKYDHDGNASTATQTMPNAWVAVRNAAGTTWYPGASTTSNGQFKLDLAAGDYVLTAYPNGSLAQKQPLEARITVAISGGTTTITTTSDGAAWDGVMDFDARTINIQFTLTDVGTSARQVLILNEGLTELIAISSVSPNSSGNALHKLALPAGTYKFKLQKLLDDTTTDACRLSATITVSTTTGLDATANTALNAWGNTFDATGDVLACKS